MKANKLAALLLSLSLVSCGGRTDAEISSEIDKNIYSDLNYTIIQGDAVREPSETDGMEYVFIPLTFTNNSTENIIFSSEVCIKASAEPSGEKCPHADKTAVSAARESIADFELFDGVISANEVTAGWLVFVVPTDTDAVNVDFFTGYASDEFISFTCYL